MSCWSTGPSRRNGGASNARRRTFAPDRHQSGAALLHQLVAGRRLVASLEPCPGGSKRRVTGEGKLAAGREDSQPVVGGGISRLEEKRRFG